MKLKNLTSCWAFAALEMENLLIMFDSGVTDLGFGIIAGLTTMAWDVAA